jgi:hypothetical protein
MDAALAALQRRLRGDPLPATVARHAVAAAFAALRRPAVSPEARTALISVCLAQPQQVLARV